MTARVHFYGFNGRVGSYVNYHSMIENFAAGATRVSVAVTPEQALALLSNMRAALYVVEVTAVPGLEETAVL